MLPSFDQLKVSLKVFPSVPSTQFSMRKTRRLRGERASLPTKATTPTVWNEKRKQALLPASNNQI